MCKGLQMSSRRERARRENGENSTEESGLLGARQVIRNMAMKGPRQVILGGIRIPLGAARPATAILGRLLEAIHRENAGWA